MKTILSLLLIIITFSLTTQDSYIPSIRTYTTKDGLSSNEVYAIHKDARGFMWIGTGYGLNRFDGQHFEVFSNLHFATLKAN